MRNTFTLLLLLFIITGTAQSVLQKNNPADADARYKFKTVCSPLVKDLDPLYIIDGMPVETADLKKIDPALIDSIFILKDSLLRNFSCRIPRPVVLIITRRSNNKTLIITDKDGHAPVFGATVTFISSDKRDTLMYVADSLGKVGLKELSKRKSYTVRVSSSGYVPYTGLLPDQVNGEIKLERDFKTGPDVVVTSFHAIGCCRSCGGGHQLSVQDCGIQVALIRDVKLKDSLVQPVAHGFRIYPNPVHRGEQINLRLLQGYFPEGSIQVFSLDGKKLFSVPVNAGKKQGQVLIPTEQRWAAGIYIFQLVYANGRVGASEKVIIQ